MTRDARVDAYIERQAAFAKPILTHLRDAVHAACPAAEEGIKWGMPTFLYKGEILAHLAAFNSHASFGFWRGSLVVGEENEQKGAMGQFGRLISVADLPDEATLAELIRKAVSLADAGAKPPRNKTTKVPLPVPDDLMAALQENKSALATFEAFSASCRREYAEWIIDAKRAETRAKRVAQAVEWMAEGKKRNWKYEKC
jgi:uncharacterized protein YdeI (YjbR/CyaY-like superfamily)